MRGGHVPEERGVGRVLGRGHAERSQILLHGVELADDVPELLAAQSVAFDVSHFVAEVDHAVEEAQALAVRQLEAAEVRLHAAVKDFEVAVALANVTLRAYLELDPLNEAAQLPFV